MSGVNVSMLELRCEGWEAHQVRPGSANWGLPSSCCSVSRACDEG
jgi:hypothetical protein